MTRQQPQPPVPRRGLALAVLLLPISLTLLSVTSINVALPAIRQSLALTGSEQALVLTSYTVAFALVLLPAGRAGDRYGHKRVFLVGVVAFTLACAWCALAPDATQLILARVLAGIAGGLVLTPLNALIQLLYGSHERARPFAIMGAVFGAASAAGPVLGGLLMQVGGEYGWHLVFWINVPFGVLAIAAAALLLPPDHPLGARGSDPLGLTLFSLGVVTVVLPFATGTGVTPTNAGMLGAGLAMLVAFALWERWRERTERFAIVPLRLWQRPLTIGVVSTFLGFAAFTASFLMLALLWLDGLGRSAIEAGLVVTPFAFGSIIGSIASRPLSDRFGVRVAGAGLLLITAGLTVVSVLIATLPPASITFLLMLAPLLTIGFGVGLFVGPNTNAAFALTEHRDAGVASAMITTAQRTGTAVGIGVLSALYALAPGGSASLANQTTASVISASLAAVAVLVLLVGRRNRSVPAPAHAAVPAP
ncbi:Major Facilitator Superfamily protein [Agrococcus baldri]|uniref:Major Facilitator Superfamily protein n=1 Tax=Agrococcus baldri TaxID=153730 RepID=A0AA94HKV3_9MICO|nr:MFS transporter [Agrococcus baldri]SFS00591.1 Major Facilitator Superfamily protein [Agrococcus baldri]